VLNKAVEVVKKPLKHGSNSGDGVEHGKPEEVAEGSGLGGMRQGEKKDVRAGDVEVASTAS